MKALKIFTLLFFLASTSQAQSKVFKLLFSECGNEAKMSFADRVHQVGPEIENDLLNLMKNGPEKRDTDMVNRHLKGKYQSRQEKLEENGLQVNAKFLQIAQKETEEEFIQRRTQLFTDGMMIQGMRALKILNSDLGIKMIRQFARDQKHPYSAWARKILAED